MHVLSVSSLKGGVGKTTVTLGLASAAFSRGIRVLVVDLDPQADASTGMQVDVAGHGSIADVLAAPKDKTVRGAIAPSGWTKLHPGTVDVLIGSPAATNFDGPHPTVREIWKLEEALAVVEGEYDLVLIDTAPSLNALTRTAWVASDRVVIVTEPALFSVAAADRALRAIEEIRRGLSPRLQPLGIIVNRFREQSAEHQYRLREMSEMFGPLVIVPSLPERTSLQQAQGSAKPVHLWPGDSAVEMAGFFDQLLDRVIKSAQIGSNPIATNAPEETAAAPEAPVEPSDSDESAAPVESSDATEAAALDETGEISESAAAATSEAGVSEESEATATAEEPPATPVESIWRRGRRKDKSPKSSD